MNSIIPSSLLHALYNLQNGLNIVVITPDSLISTALLYDAELAYSIANKIWKLGYSNVDPAHIFHQFSTIYFFNQINFHLSQCEPSFNLEHMPPLLHITLLHIPDTVHSKKIEEKPRYYCQTRK